MDLFDDLPEPDVKLQSTNTLHPKEKRWEFKSAEILFSDLPPPSSQQDCKSLKRKSDNDEPVSKKPSLALFKLQGFSAQRKGEREEMQDYHIMIEDYRKDIPHFHSSVSRMCLYGVFDGHGGARASKFVSSHLQENMANSFLKVDPTQIEKDIKRAILETFKKTDEDFLKEAKSVKPSWKDGTTAIVILVVDNILYIANIGDSKAIICRYSSDSKKNIAIPLSKDHNPTEYTERMRIQKAGGYVRDGRVMGILEVSRSIGDGQYKALGVTCIPDIKRCQLTEDDSFILLACDGLWKVFTSDEVIQIVLNSTKKNAANKTEVCYETACNRLVSEAVRKQSGDNVTVLIIAINK